MMLLFLLGSLAMWVISLGILHYLLFSWWPGAIWLLSALSGIVLIVLLKLQRQPDRASIPGCGKCGYPVKGLAAWICPECGADIQVVGTQQPRLRKSRLSGAILRPLALLAWGLFACTTISILLSVIMTAWTNSMYR